LPRGIRFPKELFLAVLNAGLQLHAWAYSYMPDINAAVTCFETCLLVEKVTMEFDDIIWRPKFGYIFYISDILSEGQNK
jgi:hypothetical protein